MSTITETDPADMSILATATASSNRGRPRRQYKCAYCAKTFKRGEHRTRHERTHTHEKPFVCRYCRKSYSRKDLVTRHERTLHADLHDGAQQPAQDNHRRDSDESIHAQVTVIAHPPSVRPVALGTPPGDDPSDGLQQHDFDKHGLYPLLPDSEPSPRDHVVFSPTPSISASASSVASSTMTSAPLSLRRHRQSSSHSSAAPAALGSERFQPSHLAPVVDEQSGPNLVDPALTRQQLPSSLSDHPSASHPARDTETCYNPNSATSRLDTYAAPSEDPVFDMMRLHGSMNMGLDMDMPMSDMMNSDNLSPRQRVSYDARPHDPIDHGAAPFFFNTSLPSLSMDLSAFAFSPMSMRPDDHGQVPVHIPENLNFHDPSADAGAYTDLNHLPQPAANPLPNSRSLYLSQPSCTSDDLPVLVKDKRQPPFVVRLDDVAYASMRNDLDIRLGGLNAESVLPPSKVLQSFLSSYISSFHSHLPIIHLQSFHPRKTPSPLILAMCSIGALYRLDRRRSRQLHDMAVRSVSTIACPSQDDDDALLKDVSVWYVQARMLLSFYDILSGDEKLLSKCTQDNGFYTTVFDKARKSLERNKNATTWRQWIEYESWKRLLGGMFIASTVQVVLFNVNPGFSSSQDLDFEVFQDESLWNATSSNEWQDLRTSKLKQQQQHQGSRCRTFKDALMDTMLEKAHQPNHTPYRLSSFSALVLMYAVVIHMWQRLQVFQAFPAPWEAATGSASGFDALRSSLLDSGMRSLARCESFLRNTEDNAAPNSDAEDSETSLIFNCQTILRIAYVRLFKPVSPSNRISLVQDPSELDASITSFVWAKLDRTPQLLDAVARCFEGLRITVSLGHMLVRKTAAFRWSVEHAIAGWESALLVTKWIHSVEMDNSCVLLPGSREAELFALVKEVLEEAEYDLNESDSLAAGLARTWGCFLEDVWVWAITPRMGTALELLAKAYERDGKTY